MDVGSRCCPTLPLLAQGVPVKLPRLRVWTLMILVAVVGISFRVPETIRQRQIQFSRLAYDHRARMICFGRLDREIVWYDGYRNRVTLAQHGWHTAMAEKYARAGDRPWLPVAPDPPPPE
jgi:hypothetical protein